MMMNSPLPLTHPLQPAWVGEWTHPVGIFSYQLPHLWALHWYDYSAKMEINGKPVPIQRGSMTIQSPGMVSRYHWTRPGRHLAAHFTPPVVQVQLAFQLPVYLNPELVGANHRRLIQQSAEAWPIHPAKTTAILWHLLWSLAETCGQAIAPSQQAHPAVTKAMTFIDKHLDETINIEDIVATAGISHNHLIRMFHHAHGLTIAGYLRRRRMEKARHLLTGSTLPIKAVAIECGVPDLQAFNKLVRRELGASPTQLRAGGTFRNSAGPGPLKHE